jgi:hypothetical protein
MSVRRRRGLLLLALACTAPRGEGRAAAAMAQATGTPGVCGYWEQTDSTGLAACRRTLLTGPAPGVDRLIQGDCGFYQTLSLDSLRACLGRVDSAAARCPMVGAWRVRQADGVIRAAEWRRCEPPKSGTEGDGITWPLHFLLLRRDTLAGSPTVFSYSNLEEPGVSGLDTVLATDLDDDGTDEIFFLDRIYGTGAIFEPCALAVFGGTLRCWRGATFDLARAALRPGESLFKGWIPVGGGPRGGPGSGRPMPPAGGSLWYFTPVYREGDGNCCPSAGASLWLEARPRAGRFETGFVLRTMEDSTGVIMGTDTLRR